MPLSLQNPNMDIPFNPDNSMIIKCFKTFLTLLGISGGAGIRRFTLGIIYL